MSLVFFHLDLTHTSVLRHARDNTARRSRRSDILSLEVAQEARAASAREGATATERIHLARTTEIARADGVSARAGRSEDLAGGVRLDGGGDVLEGVALGDDGGAGADLEGVARARVPVVVDGVEKRVAAYFRGAAADVVDVVALERDHVVGAGQVQGPVVLAVAGGGPGGGAVDLRVGDCDAVGGRIAEDDVLAADEGGLGVGLVWIKGEWEGEGGSPSRGRSRPCRRRRG